MVTPSTAESPDWSGLTARTLAELQTCEPLYRPTNFWTGGLTELLDDLKSHGLERFKSWPHSTRWFYPRYGNGFSNATIAATFEAAAKVNPWADQAWISAALNGSLEARRDFDVAGVCWNHDRWPADLDSFGESTVGTPAQAYPVGRNGQVRFGRPYLSYLILLAALSNHVDAAPRSFLEIGGGFGVLGEIVLARDPEARYVDIDIPPLVTVASYYLTELFGTSRVLSYDASVPSSGPVEVPRSAVLPSWRIADVRADFDVFVNSFSFQEMEPDVVDNYIEIVCAKNVRYAVSLNARHGTYKAERPGGWGSLRPVNSADIIEMFTRRGYELVGQYDDPMVHNGRQINVLRRR
ncbi:putative sugar O-methyltransferase [Kribbella sp. CA-253562]|uniref:putative sugar O-methyltransferase n=1 Tax=Kribbella sp. CA-253562 TaxID=3239942 RepID=UPI003D8AF575